MAENVPILTQSSLDSLKFNLQEVVSNLATHANESLSRAHGINLIQSPYTDDHGNQVSAWQARWSVNGVLYYSPAATTALAGQPAVNGLVDFSQSTAQSASETSWVTSNSTIAVDPLDVNALITAHSLLGHWEAHGGVVAITKDVFDSFGNKVGRNVLQITIADQLFEIPCDTQLGGPP